MNEEITKAVEKLLKSLTRSAQSRFRERYQGIKTELDAFKDTMKSNLIGYTEAMANGELTEEQFKSLLADDMHLLEMKGLTQAGITAAEADRFIAASFKKIVHVIITVVLPAII
jgi:hypothetical protein